MTQKITNPSKQENNNFWPDTARNWFDLILKIILIVGGILAAWQYFSVQQENRIKQTMEQLKTFNSDPLLESHLKLQQTWDQYISVFQKLNLQQVADNEMKIKIQTKIVIEVITKNKLQREIELIINFYENLQICVHHNICDATVSHAFFDEYAKSFYKLHKPWIKARRNVIPHYAEQLQTFINTK